MARSQAAPRKPAVFPPTLGEIIAHGEKRFKAARLSHGHGFINAYDEAACLALHALGLPPEPLAPRLGLRPTPAQAYKIGSLFDRRVRERRPAAYLTRETRLGDYRFYVDERVIVPRSYIAELLREDLAPWIRSGHHVRAALDLCTGSGCLAIMLAHSFRRARIDASDVSGEALQVARRNIAAYRLHTRIRLVRSDLYASLAGRRYDLIVANPPYVTAAVMRRLPREYRHEPTPALAGGKDGLDFARAILECAPAHLEPGGMLVLEVGHNRHRLERIFARTPFVWPYTSAGDDCVALVTRDDLAKSLISRSGHAGTR
ncbi:MAG: 50S ribosomal protein L3 N(5)-glutamine methyltransferase [Betaproteobacteria bacterium]